MWLCTRANVPHAHARHARVHTRAHTCIHTQSYDRLSVYRVSSQRQAQQGLEEGEATASATNWVNTDVPVLRATSPCSSYLPSFVRVATIKKRDVRASTSGDETARTNHRWGGFQKPWNPIRIVIPSYHFFLQAHGEIAVNNHS